MRSLWIALALTLTFGGCAKKTEEIAPAYVPTAEYSDMSCRQLKSELIDINRHLRVIAGVQDDLATKDKVVMGVGLVVFWPALFLLADGEDKQHEIAELKGRYEAIRVVATRKGCSFARDLNRRP